MSNAESQEELYKYVELEKGQIRIFHLLPGNNGSQVSGEISIVNIEDEGIEYSALSWEWGNVPPTESIRLRNQQGSTRGKEEPFSRMLVKPNLLAGLKALRNKDKSLKLWIDAICINQVEKNDDHTQEQQKNLEKSFQIAMMTDIFEKATKVLVWLGPEADDSDIAMDFIPKLVAIEDTDHIAVSMYGNAIVETSLGPFFKLLRRGWFSRRWVVQVRHP